LIRPRPDNRKKILKWPDPICTVAHELSQASLMLAIEERRNMESLFYWGTAIVALMGLAVFVAGLVIDRVPVDGRDERHGREGPRR
jgi:hypothetical protein